MHPARLSLLGLLLAVCAPRDAAAQTLLFDQQRLVNHPGAGSQGADVSVGMTSAWSIPIGNAFRVADDFVVADPGGWTVTRVRTYVYVRTNPPTVPSPVTAFQLRIWDAGPWEPTANLVFGDTTTDRLVGSGWSHIYFVTPTGSLSSTDRPVFYADAEVGVHVPPGTYWLDYTFDVLPAPLEGPYSPLNPYPVGNAHWGGSANWPVPPNHSPVGLPFRVYGAVGNAGPLGSTYCQPAATNSSLFPGALHVTGSVAAAANEATLTAYGLPVGRFGYFLNARQPGNTPNPSGSQGTLCLGGSIGRYTSSVANTGWEGTLSLDLDLASTPTPTGSIAILSGETWYFQCWYRDHVSVPTSNFTSAASVAFQ